MDGARPVSAPRGSTLTARQWTTEAPLRMLMNNLDPEVAERPDDLVVYGGTGRAARDWASFDAMVRTLTTLEPDETMLVQTGRPVGVMQTHEWAPRVLIANSNLVPDWANWPEFRRLEHLGLTMYGQMTAGSWIYIGTQGIVQGTYETFAAVAEKRCQAARQGRLGRHAHPDRRLRRHGRRPAAGRDPQRRRLPGRRRRPHPARAPGRAPLPRRGRRQPRRRGRHRPGRQGRSAARWSVGVVGNAAEVFPELLRRGVPIDIVTDQTSAHDPLSYLPEGIGVDDWPDYAEKKPEEFTDRARESMAKHVEAMVDFMDAGRRGLRLRQLDPRRGPARRLRLGLSTSPASSRPTSGRCSARARARSAGPRSPGTRSDIAATDRAVMDLFPDNDRLQKWMRGAQEKIAFQGLPARICWLGYGERDKAGLAFNDLVASGEVQRADRHRPRPPRLRLGRLALPRDRVDARRLRRHRRLAAAQRPGQHGVRGLVGLDPPRRRRRHRPLDPRRPGLPRRRHALAAEKLARVLTNDPGMGVIRHVDAGYDLADEVAAERGVRVPMREG